MTLVFKANHPDDLRNEILKYLAERWEASRMELSTCTKQHQRIASQARFWLIDDLMNVLGEAVIDDSL